MPKKQDEFNSRAVLVLGEAAALLPVLYDRLYSRAGDAWQFKNQVEKVVKELDELIKEMSPEPEPEPEPEPTVGSDEG